MNEITLYNITGNVFDHYKNNAKRGATAPKEVVERKLSALIHNCFSSRILPIKFNLKRLIKDKNRIRMFHKHKLYKFDGFRMITNENTKTIIWIFWKKENHVGRFLTKEERINLQTTYNKLGLNNSGNGWITEKRLKELV
jgi:hypothetical protein